VEVVVVEVEPTHWRVAEEGSVVARHPRWWKVEEGVVSVGAVVAEPVGRQVEELVLLLALRAGRRGHHCRSRCRWEAAAWTGGGDTGWGGGGVRVGGGGDAGRGGAPVSSHGSAAHW
jgi:hypothetical protein